jgi:hypothetical protein
MGLSEAVPRAPSCKIVVESTPNGASGEFYSLYQQAKAGKGGWKAIFIPWHTDKSCSMNLDPGEKLEPYATEESALMEKYHLTPEQIKWRRWKIEDIAAKNKGDADEFYQEYPEDDESCFLTGGSCFFDTQAIRILMSQCKEEPPQWDDMWAIWKAPEPGHQYVIGADVAEGNIRNDYSAAVIRDVTTNERVAILNEPIDTFEYAEELCRVGRMYNDAIVAVERNGLGLTTLRKMMELGYEYLYRSGGKPGWVTTSANRLPMLADLRQEVREMDSRFNDKRLLTQMLHFMKAEIGKHPEAKSGEHDDLVIADAIAGQIRSIDEPSIEEH